MQAAPRQARESAVASERARPFHGWRVVAAAFVAEFVSVGCTFSAFGVFVVPLAEAFATTRGTIATGAGLLMLVSGLGGALLGRAVDRGPLRALMLTGVFLLAAGLWLASRASALWQAGLAFCALAAVGALLFGPLPAVALVGSWFVRRRGLALGITVAGATVAGMLAPPLAAALIERLGWRGALAAFAVGGAALAAPVLWACVVRRPEDLGQAPDGDAPSAEASLPCHPAPDTAELLRDPRLWLISIGFALLYASPIVVALHLVPYALDLGLSSLEGAVFFTAMAPFSLLGKLAFGFAADRVAARAAVWIAVSLMSAAWALLLAQPSHAQLLAAGCVFGLGVGAVGPLHGVIVGACFGRDAFGRVMGIGGLAGLPIVAGAGPLVGFLFDATASYRAGFALQLALLAAAGATLLFVRIPRSAPHPIPRIVETGA
jgi:MFS family permease